MNIVRLTHELAMEMGTIADVAKGKGFRQDALEFYRTAFQLEKKACDLTSPKEEDPIPHFLFLRGAAAFANEAEMLEESLKLVERGKKENPPTWIIEELVQIEDLVKKKMRNIGTNKLKAFLIDGIITKADSKESEITLENREQQNFSVRVPSDKMSEIVKNYWQHKVIIEAHQTPQGGFMLEDIRAAA